MLDQLLQEHRDTLIEQIVVFRWYLRDMFNESASFSEALEKLAGLLLDGWADLSSALGKVMAFLEEHLEHADLSTRSRRSAQLALGMYSTQLGVSSASDKVSRLGRGE